MQLSSTPPRTTSLAEDARVFYRAVSELVRVYQFRDRHRLCYHDISVTQCYALSALLLRGPLRLDALAHELHLDKSTASRMVDGLEEKGYVRRGTDDTDRRALRIAATRKGRNLHDRIERELVEEQTELLGDLDPEVRRISIELVRSLTRAARAKFGGGSE